MLNKIIRDLRMNMDMTQAELANRLGMSQRAIAHYETGDRQPEYDVLLKMAELFNVSVDYMLGRTTNRNEVFYLPEDCKALVRKLRDSHVPIKALEEYIDYLERHFEEKKDS